MAILSADLLVRTSAINVVDFSLPPGARLISSPGTEARTLVTARHIDPVVVRGSGRHQAVFSTADTTFELSVRDTESLDAWMSSLGTADVVIDITGMPYPIWAPLVRSATRLVPRPKVCYVEPSDYRRNPTPAGPSEMFDLSEHTEGVAALPGFSRLSVPPSAQDVFVALLGFEGARILHIADTLEFAAAKVVPVIPMPGFRLEYPSFTVACNREFIESQKAWPHFVLAPASDPFEVFAQLTKHLDRTAGLMRIALVGTKPHGLGAVLLAVAYREKVELLYDFPHDRDDRAQGVGQVLVFNLENFLESVGKA